MQRATINTIGELYLLMPFKAIFQFPDWIEFLFVCEKVQFAFIASKIVLVMEEFIV